MENSSNAYLYDKDDLLGVKPLINTLSYSKIKTLDSCSWIYYATYVLNVPQAQNDGATLGNVIHEIIELLANHSKYFGYVNNIVANKKLSTLLKRLIKFKLFKAGLPYEDFRSKAESFLLTFLLHDFWFDGCKELGIPEYKFEIKKNYYAKGFIDRYAIYNDGVDDYVIIRDAKTQKNLFTQDELKLSIQALIYLLAIREKHPNISIDKSSVEFVMLAHNTIQVVKDITNEDLDGLESYLASVQKKVDNFTAEDAVSNLAADKGWNVDGFKGMLICGRATSKGQLKKNGQPMWACQYKFPFEYYALYEDDKLIKTSLDKEDLEIKDGRHIKKLRYNGCIKFQ